MIGEVLLGLFFLALGCLCLGPSLRLLLIGSTGPTRSGAEPNEERDRSKMIISVTLGIILLLIGKGLLVMALAAMI